MTLTIDTTRFGEIEVPSSEIITGEIFGFTGQDKWILVREQRMKPFFTLQSILTPNLAFVVISPWEVRPDYSPNLNIEDYNPVKPIDKKIEVFCIITLSKRIKDITINLQGPVLINRDLNLLHQVVLYDDRYTTREPLDYGNLHG